LIPKKASGAPRKYDFEGMIPEDDWIEADDYDHARSIKMCAIKRGFKVKQRTVNKRTGNKEVRVYMVGRL
jgi:hypothetical protein